MDIYVYIYMPYERQPTYIPIHMDIYIYMDIYVYIYMQENNISPPVPHGSYECHSVYVPIFMDLK